MAVYICCVMVGSASEDNAVLFGLTKKEKTRYGSQNKEAILVVFVFFESALSRC